MKDKQKQINRRTFLKTTSVGSASFVLSSGVAGKTLAAQASNESVSKKMPMRILGKTGASVSILGMGGSIDTSGYMNILRIGLNMGINYWDTSHSYGNGKNEEVLGQFFSKYPEDRKKVFQVTKASRVTDPKGMAEQLNTSLERMKTDYIDLYFMHMLQDGALLTPEIKSWVEQKKKEGKIKFFGFSCHANMAKLLMHASTLGWIDSVMASYSYQLLKNDDIQKAIDACVKANIGLVAMKTQGQRIGPPANMPQGREGGPPDSQGQPEGRNEQPPGPPPGMETQTQSKEPEDFTAMSHFIKKGYTLEQAKLKVVWEDKRIAVCLSEMTNMTMIKDNVAAATDSVKLTDKDRDMLDRLAQYNRSYYCHGCLRCESCMDSESRIPDVLRYMMYFNSYGKTDDARRLFRELPEHIKSGLASRDYSAAERACPNKIKIGKAMQEAVRLMG
jgi:uncharacterized protein